jgi:hypothetical protein
MRVSMSALGLRLFLKHQLKVHEKWNLIGMVRRSSLPD